NLLAMTLEGQIVRVADIVAYVNHDLDDAIRGRVLRQEEVPAEIRAALGETHSERITRRVRDIVDSSRLDERPHIPMRKGCLQALVALRDFLYARVYENRLIRAE